MKRSSKLLLLKNHRDHPFARSWIADSEGVYGRSVHDSAQLGAMLRGEQFDLVMIDQRESDDELISTIEGVRQYQQQAKLVIVSEKVGLQQVVQAIRYNVRDIFQPPYSAAAMANRLEKDLSEQTECRPRGDREALAYWSEFLQSVDIMPARNGDAPTVAHAAPAHAGGRGEAVSEVERALDERTREVGELRLQLEKNTAGGASTRGKDIRIKALQDELDSARARISELEKAEASETAAAGSQEIVLLQNEIEFHVGNTARLQEQLATSVLGHAEMTKEVARLGAVEVKFQRSESQLAALRLEHTATVTALREAEAKAGRAESRAALAEEAREIAETDLTHERERIEAAERALALEREQIVVREAEASKMTAAAAQRLVEVEEMLCTERTVMEKQQAANKRQQSALQHREEVLQQLSQTLDERAVSITEQAREVASAGEDMDAAIGSVLSDAADLASRIQDLEKRRALLREPMARVQDHMAVA